MCVQGLRNLKLTKLAFDRAEYLVKSAELGRLAFEEFSFFDVIITSKLTIDITLNYVKKFEFQNGSTRKLTYNKVYRLFGLGS